MTPQPTRRPNRIRGPCHPVLTFGLAGIALLCTWLVSLGSSTGGQEAPVTRYRCEVVHVYPHDTSAFTQGLLFRKGFLFESTGLNSRSTLRKVRLETGEILDQRNLDSAYFAEGLADWGNHLVQLTLHSGIGFVYDLQTFALTQTFRYSGEGWGLTRHRDRLIMSDGTSTLRFLDPDTFVETGRISVTENGNPIANLNELEIVRGNLFANVWPTDDIVIIDPDTGIITGRLDLGGLLSSAECAHPVDVLNGIAYDAEGDRVFITGKLWPKLFEIRLKAEERPGLDRSLSK